MLGGISGYRTMRNLRTWCQNATWRRLVSDFRADRRGNVIIMFALSLIPLLGVIGVAIDYSRASTANRLLSDAIDSAALMAARDASKLTDAQVRSRVDGWIRANLHGDAAASFSGATTTIDRTARTIGVSASLNVAMGLTTLIGQSSVPVSATSQSTWGTNKIELALALDNTGSMASSGKMTALKQASLDLIQIMKDATTETGQIKISIVPFATQIRLPTSYKNETWLRWDQTQTTCSGYGWSQTCTTTTISKTNWQGCVADRDKNYDTQDGGSLSSSAQLYPADFCDSSSLTQLRPLTDDWTALNSTVNAMTPSGNTNVAIGAIWGMASVSPALPLNEAQAYGTPRLNKYMILLTDGDNTANRFGDNQSTIDTRTSMACTTAKTAGIKVYTIRVIDGNSTLLRNCATDPSMYFEVTSASQLSPIFKQIASEISQVRLTQ
jgi:Flp pilus assembly protein TadG